MMHTDKQYLPHSDETFIKKKYIDEYLLFKEKKMSLKLFPYFFLPSVMGDYN